MDADSVEVLRTDLPIMSRGRLFKMINSSPTLFETVTQRVKSQQGGPGMPAAKKMRVRFRYGIPFRGLSSLETFLRKLIENFT